MKKKAMSQYESGACVNYFSNIDYYFSLLQKYANLEASAQNSQILSNFVKLILFVEICRILSTLIGFFHFLSNFSKIPTTQKKMLRTAKK